MCWKRRARPPLLQKRWNCDQVQIEGLYYTGKLGVFQRRSIQLPRIKPCCSETWQVSRDGLKVLCGTARGQLGALDVAAHAYCTLQRSHVGAVRCVAHADVGARFATAGADGTARVWDELSGAQLAELKATCPEDSSVTAPTCCAWRPKFAPASLAAGLESGAIVVFDESASVSNSYYSIDIESYSTF